MPGSSKKNIVSFLNSTVSRLHSTRTCLLLPAILPALSLTATPAQNSGPSLTPLPTLPTLELGPSLPSLYWLVMPASEEAISFQLNIFEVIFL